MADVYGLRVINPDGSVQIDENYRNMQFITKQMVTVTRTDNNERFWYAEIDTTDSTMYALRTVNTSGTVRFFCRIAQNKKLRIYALPKDTQIEIYAFRFVPVTSVTGYGLVVSDTSGVIVFSSQEKYAKVKDVIAGVQADNLGETLKAARTYNFKSAIVANVCSTVYERISQYNDDSLPFYEVYGDRYNVTSSFSGNNINVYSTPTLSSYWESGQSDGFYRECAGSPMLVLDVTNY